jgi:hypothetical protein
MIHCVQLLVQLLCNPVQLNVSATPCLPIGKLHACTRAARLSHGIGSHAKHGKGGKDLIKPASALISAISIPPGRTLICPGRSPSHKINIGVGRCVGKTGMPAVFRCREPIPADGCSAEGIYARGLPHSKSYLGSNGARSCLPGQRRGLRSRQGLGNLCQEDPPVACRPRKTSARSIVDVFACIRGPASQNWRRPFLKNPDLLRNAVSRGCQTRPCVLAVGHV